jgi:hypothetical protein
MSGLDRIFKDLMQDNRNVGDKLVVTSGDFRVDQKPKLQMHA